MGERASLVPILSSLSRIELDSGNDVEARLLRSQAKEHIDFIAHNLTTELRESFFRLPDVAKVLETD